jgi:site-specific recombinase XerD
MNSLTRPDPATVHLSERSRAYVDSSKARNTVRAYHAALQDFKMWCAHHDATWLPALPQTLVDYFTALADLPASVSTIHVRAAAIAFAHRSNHLDDPTQHEAVKILLQGIRRAHKTAPHQKAPITRDDLKTLLQHTTRDLRGRRDRALLLVGFAGAFRRSELAALTLRDVRFSANEVQITVRASKTDQEGAGFVKHIPALENSPLCPVRALKAYLREAEISDGPIFRKIDRWNKVSPRGINAHTVARLIKRLCERANLPALEFAGHSLRAGFVTQATADGAYDWQIMRVTGHKSVAMLDRYNRDKGQGQTNAIRRALGE